MSDFDATGTADSGHVIYDPASPYTARCNDVSLANFPLGASGADTLDVLPLEAGEVVVSAYLRVLGPADTGVTLTLTDTRTGGGALLAASAADAAAGTTYAGAGAKVGAITTGAGAVQVTTAAAVAASKGTVRVYAIIAKAF